jgi:hypothetical protein
MTANMATTRLRTAEQYRQGRDRLSAPIICGLLAAVLLAPTLSVASAQPNVGRGTLHAEQSEQDACKPDVMKLCRQVSNSGDLMVLECLQKNRKRLSKACSRVLDEHGV